MAAPGDKNPAPPTHNLTYNNRQYHMNHQATTNLKAALVVGMSPFFPDSDATGIGAMYDREDASTRCIPGTPYDNHCKKCGLSLKPDDGRCFDIYNSEIDLLRVEAALNLKTHTREARLGVVEKLVKNWE